MAFLRKSESEFANSWRSYWLVNETIYETVSAFRILLLTSGRRRGVCLINYFGLQFIKAEIKLHTNNHCTFNHYFLQAVKILLGKPDPVDSLAMNDPDKKLSDRCRLLD